MGTPSSRRGRKRTDSCAVVLLVGASLFAGLAVLVGSVVGRLV